MKIRIDEVQECIIIFRTFLMFTKTGRSKRRPQDSKVDRETTVRFLRTVQFEGDWEYIRFNPM